MAKSAKKKRAKAEKLAKRVAELLRDGTRKTKSAIDMLRDAKPALEPDAWREIAASAMAAAAYWEDDQTFWRIAEVFEPDSPGDWETVFRAAVQKGKADLAREVIAKAPEGCAPEIGELSCSVLFFSLFKSHSGRLDPALLTMIADAAPSLDAGALLLCAADNLSRRHPDANPAAACEAARIAVGRGACIDMRLDVRDREEGQTILWHAVDARLPEAVERLLALGADPALEPGHAGGICPLDLAAEKAEEDERNGDVEQNALECLDLLEKAVASKERAAIEASDLRRLKDPDGRPGPVRSGMGRKV
jgi:hypothetical protein